MRIEIQGSGIEFDDKVRHFTRHRVDFAMSARAEHIDNVQVHLSDTGAPGDNGEMQCLVQVRLHGMPHVIAENRDPNLYIAIHRAVDRAGWIAARNIVRQQRKAIATLLDERRLSDRAEAVRAA